MELGIVVPTYGDWGHATVVRDAVQAVEELGFSTAWFGDHIVVPRYAAHVSPPNWLEPLSCALVGAGATTRLRFGVDVLVLPYRDPVWLSQLVAGADQLSDGRLTLGVGVGYIRGEFAAVTRVPYEDRGRATDEHLRVLDALWQTDGPVSFEGEWTSFEDVLAEPKPAQRPFPLWVGGNGAPALRRAALLGNGWHPLFPTLDRYREGRRRILERRADAGIGAPFTFSYSSAATRVLEVDGSGGFTAGGTTTVPPPPEYDYAPPPPMTDDGRMLLVGTPDQLVADVAALADAGVDHLVLRFSHGHAPHDLADLVDQAARFAAEVVPGG